MSSYVRKGNWSESVENLLNFHINKEFTAYYTYCWLYSYFSRDNISYLNIANFLSSQVWKKMNMHIN